MCSCINIPPCPRERRGRRRGEGEEGEEEGEKVGGVAGGNSRSSEGKLVTRTEIKTQNVARLFSHYFFFPG